MDQLRERLAGDLSILKDDSLSETIVELLLESPTLTTSGALEDSEEMIRSCLPHLTEVKRTELILKLRERMDAFYAEQEGGEEWEEELEVHEREGLCQLCGANQRITIHHLIPKLVLKRMKNHNKEKVEVAKYLVEVCRPCHNELHRLWGHGELAREYQTVDAILVAPEIQKYLEWKRKKERTLE